MRAWVAVYRWTAATPAVCGATATPAPSTFDATFSNVKGNAWWIEAKVGATGGTLAKVDASVNGGAWKGMTLRSWGSWAVSTAAPDGAKVRLRAASTTGATGRDAGAGPRPRRPRAERDARGCRRADVNRQP